MQHLDEGTIHAWLDGELPAEERAAAEAHIAECAECAAAVAEARGFVAASSRILTALDGVPGGVLPEHSKAAISPPERKTYRREWMAAAAVLVISTLAVIANRPHREAAQLRVAAVTQGPQAPAASAALSEDRVLAAKPAAAPSARIAQPSSPAAASEPRPADQTARLGSRLQAERQVTRVQTNQVARSQIADAAPAAAAEKREASLQTSDSAGARRLAASADDVTITGHVTSDAGAPLVSAAVNVEGTGVGTLTGEDGSYTLRVPATRMKEKANTLTARVMGYKSVRAPIAPDSAAITRDFVLGSNPVALSQVVVTGAGTTAPNEKLGATAAMEGKPQLISRDTAVTSGDTVVTSVYQVNGASVTLSDRSPPSQEAAAPVGFNNQLAAKAPNRGRVNSISWRDASGHTRTLQGALTRAQLQHLRETLFGATP